MSIQHQRVVELCNVPARRVAAQYTALAQKAARKQTFSTGAPRKQASKATLATQRLVRCSKGAVILSLH